MNAGGLDRRVRIEQRVQTQSPTGELVDSWQPLGSLWAGQRDLRATERWGAGQELAEIETVWTLRWWPAASAVRPDTHRLVYRDRVYDIHGVRVIGRQDGVELATAARGEAKFGE